eukprot:6399150-Prymnesium_polylepis.1
MGVAPREVAPAAARPHGPLVQDVHPLAAGRRTRPAEGDAQTTRRGAERVPGAPHRGAPSARAAPVPSLSRPLVPLPPPCH